MQGLVDTAAPNTGDISMLLLFDTHAGEDLTGYSFKSHLNISPQKLHVH